MGARVLIVGGRGTHNHGTRRVRDHAQSAAVAQLAEQRTFNPKVVGSIPTGGIRKAKDLWDRAGGQLWNMSPICPGRWGSSADVERAAPAEWTRLPKGSIKGSGSVR